ncbi:hypothetical protein GCK72_015658 [Caenorhabditis remanei]|uniref:Uncharacterized protein n=1 Tax=Caenorhabditis remanei TaxID=31234 RepID=A0A6A5GVL5_CAERE|nr:hypothetical protein GCK72_015658 [Caenorhabditis remanei]KAF1759197.1 hypothetical protein GCK72_015658 [Caenorhabditis remanei]
MDPFPDASERQVSESGARGGTLALEAPERLASKFGTSHQDPFPDAPGRQASESGAGGTIRPLDVPDRPTSITDPVSEKTAVPERGLPSKAKELAIRGGPLSGIDTYSGGCSLLLFLGAPERQASMSVADSAGGAVPDRGVPSKANELAFRGEPLSGNCSRPDDFSPILILDAPDRQASKVGISRQDPSSDESESGARGTILPLGAPDRQASKLGTSRQDPSSDESESGAGGTILSLGAPDRQVSKVGQGGTSFGSVPLDFSPIPSVGVPERQTPTSGIFFESATFNVSLQTCTLTFENFFPSSLVFNKLFTH